MSNDPEKERAYAVALCLGMLDAQANELLSPKLFDEVYAKREELLELPKAWERNPGGTEAWTEMHAIIERALGRRPRWVLGFLGQSEQPWEPR